MRIAPPADTKLFPIDGNDTYGDCVVAATAHLFYLLFGLVIPLATALKDFAGWCSTGGCTVGWFVWKLWWNGMHGCRIKQFCKLGATQADVDWAIGQFGGCIICIYNGQHQATVIGKVGSLYRVIVWGLDGWIKDIAWADIAGSGDNELQLYTSGHFAMSATINPVMLWYSLKNNLVWQVTLGSAVILGLYFAGVI